MRWVPKRAVVVGAGLGGLAAAIRLRARGYEVVVMEALDRAGGRGRGFDRCGFHFDAGPTVITAPHLFEELFGRVGRSAGDYFELTRVDPFYRIRFADGEWFEYAGEEDRLLSEIGRLSPGDVDGYRRLARQAERIFEVGYTQLADQPFDRFTAMARVVPAMVRLGSHRTVWQMVSHYIKDERLRQAFTFEPLLVGGNPFTTTSIYLLIHWLERKWGVHFALGGTTSIVNGMTRLLSEIGVEVRYDSPVASIEASGGRVTGVRTESAEAIGADVVVCNADPAVVYSRLVPEDVRKRMNRKVGGTRASMSLFVGYFGVRGAYPELAHHTILLGPRYRELLDDIFRRRVLARDFSLYLHAPTRTDARLAPPGHETFYVLSPVPNNRSGIDWEQEREPYFDRILESLEDTILPGVRSRIVTRFTMTPREFERDLRSADGAAFGPEPVLSQSAWFRWHNRSRVLEGLYFVGAGTHPGAGVPGVLSSAKVLDRVVPDGARPVATQAHRTASHAAQ